MHIIPNGSIGTVTNNCREFINAVVTVGIAYGESIDRAIAVLQDEMQKTADMEAVLDPPPPLQVSSVWMIPPLPLKL